MKKKSRYLTLKLFVLYLVMVFSLNAQEVPPPPMGLEEPVALEIDSYLIPMAFIALLLAFFLLKKTITLPVQ